MYELSSTQIIDDDNEVSAITLLDVFLCIELTPQCHILRNVGPGTIFIGRSAECHIKLCDETLSRMHAAFRMDDDGLCFLTDLGSSNGTWRNNLRLKPNVPYELRPLDRIKLGNLRATFHVEPFNKNLMSFSDYSPSTATMPSYAAKTPSPTGSTANVSAVSSTASAHMLAPISVGAETTDLLPNGSQFVSRSPSPNSRPPNPRTSEQNHSKESLLLADMFVCGTQPEDQDSLPCCDDVRVIAESEPFSNDCKRVTTRYSRGHSDTAAAASPSVSTACVTLASTPLTVAQSNADVPLVFDSEPRTVISQIQTLELTESEVVEPGHSRSIGFIEESQVPLGDVHEPSSSRGSLLPSAQPVLTPSQIGCSGAQANDQPCDSLSDGNHATFGDEAKDQPTDARNNLIPVQNDECFDATQPMMTAIHPLLDDTGTRTPLMPMSHNDHDELTQPMRRSTRQFEKLFEDRIRPSLVDLDASGATPDKLSIPPTTKPQQPVSTVKQQQLTPVNPPDAVRGRTRQLVTTMPLCRRRKTKANGRVSELFLSDAIGSVKFRSSRLRRTLGSLDLNTSDEAALEHKQIDQLEAMPRGLVRCASKSFPVIADVSVSNENNPSSLKSKSKKNEKREFSTSLVKTPMLPRIPSPVQFPDSILSQDPSQLEDSLDPSNSAKRVLPSQSKPQEENPLASAPLVLLSPVGYHETEDTRGICHKSAVRSAGFEDSPGESGTYLSHAVGQNCPIDSSFIDISPNSSKLSSNQSGARCRSETKPSFLSHELSGGRNASRRTSHQPIRSRRDNDAKAANPTRRSTIITTTTSECSETVRRSRRLTTCVNYSVPHSPPNVPVKRARTSLCASSAPTKQTQPLADSSGCASDVAQKSYSLLISGIDVSQFQSVLSALGACETQCFMSATHLVTDGWKRTLKMLYSRARGIPIISVDWLVACKRSRKRPPPDPSKFVLAPPSPIRHTSLRSTVVRHTNNSEPSNFLNGWLLCSTPKVLPSAEDLAQLCQIAGGCWMSDDQLKDAAEKQLTHVAIITTSDELEALGDKTKHLNRRSRLSTSNRKRDRTPFIETIMADASHLPCVSVDWFLQAIMQRSPPAWPIPKSFRLN